MAKSSRKLGPWILERKIGSGGNATVWEATREGLDEPVALKVLNTHRSAREPYRRFVREIEFLQSLTDFEGILPSVEAHLPQSPTRDDRPWLAMPVARPIGEALMGQPLEVVVLALEQIARTLARLAEQYGVGHRDIKPSNLYELDGRWLVGDFGLIALPDVEKLTRTGRPLGPAHYMAYEMIVDPAGADALAADVYSFGKTIWVLATEQTFPPEGHQVAGTRQFSISDLRPHPNADALDRLVDRATQIHADLRSQMTEIAEDLGAWRELSPSPVVVAVGDLRSQILDRMATELAAEDLLERRKEQARDAVKRMNDLFSPLNAALQNVHPRAEIDISPDRYTQNMLSSGTHFGAPDIVFKFQRLSQITSGPDYNVFSLRLGRSLELTAEGEVIFRSYVDVGNPGLSGHAFNWHSNDYEASVGSVRVDAMLRDAIDETGRKLIQGLKAFVEHLPAHD